MSNLSRNLIIVAIVILLGVALLFPPIATTIGNQNTQNGILSATTLYMLPNISDIDDLQTQIQVFQNYVNSFMTSFENFITSQIILNSNMNVTINNLLNWRLSMESWQTDVITELSEISSWQSLIDTVIAGLQTWQDIVDEYLDDIFDNMSIFNDFITTVNTWMTDIGSRVSALESWRNTIDAFVTNTTAWLTSLEARIDALEQIVNYALNVADYDYIVYFNGSYYIAVPTFEGGSSVENTDFKTLITDSNLQGKSIFLKRGTYYVTSTITLTANTKIVGEERTLTILVSTSDCGSRVIQVASNIVLRGFKLDATSRSSTSEGAIFCIGANNWELSDAEIIVTNGQVIDIITGSYITIRNNILTVTATTSTNDMCIQVCGGSYLTVKGNIMTVSTTGSASASMRFIPSILSENVLITENVILGYRGILFETTECAKNVLISNNHIIVDQRGIQVGTRLNDLRIIGNYISGSTAIYLSGFSSSYVLQYALITGNTIVATGNGIQAVNYMNQCVITNNIFRVLGSRIVDTISYSGTGYVNIFVDGRLNVAVTPTLSTSNTYNTFGTKVNVRIAIGTTATTVYLNGNSLGSFTSTVLYFTLHSGEYVQVSQTSGVTWIWLTTT